MLFNKYLCTFFIFTSISLQALTTFQTTLSSGYYKDIEEKSHTTVFYNWKLNQVYNSGLESFLELELNNSFVTDKWRIYPFQMYLTLPFDNGFENAPFHNSRIKIGRQLLTEGFALNILNGALYRKYWSSDFGFVVFGGGLDTLEKSNITFDDQIYGTNIFLKKFETNFKIGPLLKRNQNDSTYLGMLSIMKSFDRAPFKPLILAKEEWDFNELKSDQFLIELDLTFDNFYLNNAYSSRKPNKTVLQDKNFIYKLCAISHQKSISSSLTWNPEGDFQVTGRVESNEYTSQSKEENGDLQEISFNWYFQNSKISPSVTRIKSWGGTLWDYNCNYKYNVKNDLEFGLSGNVANVDKINNISGWLYTAKSSIDYHFLPHWRALVAFEAERNHLFDVNGRVALYVTHFYY